MDYYEVRYPAADAVSAGSRLHVRVNKPERPDAFSVSASGRRLDTTLRAHRAGGDEVVAWDVFFRVGRPDARYQLGASGRWGKASAGTSGYGSTVRYFHVKTRG